jgi:hypothetical protein
MCNKDISYLIFDVNLLGTQTLNLSKYLKFLSWCSFVHSVVDAWNWSCSCWHCIVFMPWLCNWVLIFYYFNLWNWVNRVSMFEVYINMLLIFCKYKRLRAFRTMVCHLGIRNGHIYNLKSRMSCNERHSLFNFYYEVMHLIQTLKLSKDFFCPLKYASMHLGVKQFWLPSQHFVSCYPFVHWVNVPWNCHVHFGIMRKCMHWLCV